MAKADAMNGNYSLSREQKFRMDEISPGEMAMFVLHTLLTSGEDQVSGLWKAPLELLAKTEGGTPRHTYCRWAMQLTFAAGRCIGNLSSSKEQRELQEESVPNSAARGRGQESTPPRRVVQSSPSG